MKIRRLFISVSAIISVLLVGCNSARKTAAPVKPISPVTIAVTDTVSTVKDTVPLKMAVHEKFTIALLLPLQLEAHFKNDTNPEALPLIIPDALPALHFLEGAKLAEGQLFSEFVDVDFKIIDVGFDSLETTRVLNAEKMSGVDAIVSILAPGYNNLIATLSDRWKKPLYFFQGANTQILENHTWLRLVNPSNNTQIRQTAVFLAERYPASNYVVVYREQRKESDIASLFAFVIDSIRGKGTCKMVNYKADSWSSLKGKLVKNKRNLLIIPTSDESFLSSLLNKLVESKTEYNFMLCGMPGWENFNTIDPAIMKEMDALFFNGMYIDIGSSVVTDFRKKFIGEYHSEPLLQAYMAYDVITYISARESSYKDKVKTGYSGLLFNGSTPSQLTPVCDTCGLERKSVNIIRFDDYKYVLLK